MSTNNKSPKKKNKNLEKEITQEETFQENLDQVADQEEQEKDVQDVEEEVSVNEALDDDAIPVEEKLELLKAAWEASEAKAAEYLDGWQRAKAEFLNYKKRVNRDREQYNKDAIGRVVKNYLPVVDDLERALKDKPGNGDFATWAAGIELIYRKLVTTLENDGVVPMKVEGEMFDPNQHEAVVQIESEEHESGQIVEVLQTGYFIGERVLRPARVCIAA
jgi:molecular chaperone GrpE